VYTSKLNLDHTQVCFLLLDH